MTAKGTLTTANLTGIAPITSNYLPGRPDDRQSNRSRYRGNVCQHDGRRDVDYRNVDGRWAMASNPFASGTLTVATLTGKGSLASNPFASGTLTTATLAGTGALASNANASGTLTIAAITGTAHLS